MVTTSNTYDVGVANPASSHQTLNFLDGTPQWTTGIKSGYEATRKQGMEMAPDLQNFFERPVEVAMPDWVPGSVTPYAQIIDPWSQFWGNKRVINRITGYKLLQCTLKVKIIINGNGFYYGTLMADYVPLPVNNTVDTLSTSDRACIVQASQRTHLYLNPTQSTGGELSLPFIYYYNSLDVVTSDWNKLGRIYMREINQLKHANAATTNVSLSMYVWAENVEMSAPTMINSGSLITQAGDEYGSSSLSSMASATADAAGKLSSIPMIGPYAKATQMAAGSMGTLARMLGFSRPADITHPVAMRPKLISRMANADGIDGVARLTVDSKQELTIDPRVVGVDEDDPLIIKKICGVESYLTTFTWTVGSVDNSLLWNTRVQPTLAVSDVSLTPNVIWMPACCFAALPFKYWRGTMRFRFQIVCSAFHRGRLKFVYDPTYIGSTLEANLGYTRIIDLEKEREFSIDIGMSQARSFLLLGALVNAVNAYSTTYIGSSDPTANGMLGVYVATELTTPNSAVNNDIQINVFVSMCDDADFAQPFPNQIQSLTYSLQAGEEAQPEVSAPMIDQAEENALSCLVVDNTHDVHFGETYTSFRSLLKRYAYQGSWLCPAFSKVTWTLGLHNLPYFRGRWTNAVNVDSTTVAANLVNTCLLTYLIPAFLAVRGSIRWKYLYGTDAPRTLGYIRVSRDPNASGAIINNASAPVSTNGNTYMVARNIASPNGLDGMDITYLTAQPVAEFEVPYYSNSRFMPAKDVSNISSGGIGMQQDRHTVFVDNDSTTISYMDRHVSIGEDFSLILFQGAPPVHSYGLAAT